MTLVPPRYERFDPKDLEYGVPATEFIRVTQELIEKEDGLVNESQLRRSRDWSCLANQVVGAEVDLDI